jgi:hypothetical protein
MYKTCAATWTSLVDQWWMHVNSMSILYTFSIHSLYILYTFTNSKMLIYFGSFWYVLIGFDSVQMWMLQGKTKASKKILSFVFPGSSFVWWAKHGESPSFQVFNFLASVFRVFMGFHGSAILPYIYHIYSISYSSYASLALSQMMKCHRVVEVTAECPPCLVSVSWALDLETLFVPGLPELPIIWDICNGAQTWLENLLWI